MATVRFTRVIVLESLPDGHGHPGRRLREDIEAGATFHQHKLPVDYVRAETLEQFGANLWHVCDLAKNGDVPILHMECHGRDDAEGLVLGDGSFLPWSELTPDLLSINTATACRLFVAMGACYGAHLGSVLRPTDRAPVLAVLGPKRQTQQRHLSGGFGAFYARWLQTGSGGEALNAMKDANSEAGDYALITAEAVFRDVYTRYMARETTDKAYWARAKRIKATRRVKASVSDIAAQLRARERSNFAMLRDQFFMCDFYPDNRARFNVGFDELLKNARN